MFSNTGSQGAVFHVYDQNNLARIPRRYTLEAGKQLNDTAWSGDTNGNYNLSVYGPNGFVRQFSGNAGSGATVELQACYDVANGAVYATVNNTGTQDVQVTLSASAYASVYTGGPWTLNVPAGHSAEQHWPLANSGNWYDFTLSAPNLVRRFAGRVETGAPGISDPAMASGLAI
jgi:phospholipase C